jgi:histidinol-phosphate/aromatic aminotransferase/cobyric acid decarboxylase-like protein
MTFLRKTQESLLERGYSRRQISRIALGAAAAIPFFNEFAQAQQAEQLLTRVNGRRSGNGGNQAFDPDVVRISSNENPMGPSKEGIEAMAKVGPLGWRYAPQGENLEFEAPAAQHRERQAWLRQWVPWFQHSAC